MRNIPISVILPVYNGGHYLVESVNSIMEQSLSDFELLIIDDCSTDGSWEYLSSLTDTRIKIIKNESNNGLFHNLNFLINQSKSELIKLWAQDDIMLPDCLQSFVSFHAAHPEIGFSYSQRIMIDENGWTKENNNVDTTPEIVSKELHALIAYYTGSIAGNIANVCIHKKAIKRVGLFDESMKISADFDMWVRIAEFFPVGHINKKLIKLRDHKGQLSRNEKYYINHIKEDMIIFKTLDEYSGKQIKKYGNILMRNNKLIFYYLFMIKFFIQFKIRSSAEVFYMLVKYDNIICLTYYFMKLRVFKIKSQHTPIQFYKKYLQIVTPQN